MQLRSILSFLSVLFFIHKTLSETIARGPVNIAADIGVWANFTCSVSCDYLITWYVEGYPSDISTTCSNTLNGMMVCKETTHRCATGGARNYSETLRVLAKEEHEGSKIAVQCSAVARSLTSRNSCEPFVTYSRFALLSVNELPDNSTPTPTPCSPQDTSTVTETTVVTETQAAVTITESTIVVSTVTVMAEPAVTPPPLPPPNSATDSRGHLGTILTRMFMWVFTIGVGALFASMAFLR